MHIKPLLKHGAQRILPGRLPAFVVASFGRSRSFLICNAILNSIAQRLWPVPQWALRRISRDTAWQLDKTSLLRGVVYNTHEYPDALSGVRDVKSVFLFGSAKEAALSVYSCQDRYGTEWLKEHFRHLRSNLGYDDLFQCDALRFQNQLMAWCGFEVPLPPRRARTEKKYPSEVEAAADKVYGPIVDMINRLPHAFLAGPEAKKLSRHITS
jgi:hypothetical protein